MKDFSRRTFLVSFGGTAATVLLAACRSAPASPTAVPSAPAASTAPGSTPTSAPAAAATPGAAPKAGGTPATTTSAPSSGTLTTSFMSLNATTNPLTTTASPQMLNMIFNRLVERKADYNGVVPGLADSWKISDDGLNYTFNLRKDVKWHDGKPFTADDVIWNYTYQVDGKYTGLGLISAYLFAIKGAQDFHAGKSTEIPGLKALDPYTVEITIDKPSATFLNGLSAAYILPKHILSSVPVEKLIHDDFFTMKLVGTGSYAFKQYVDNQFLTLARNPSFFRGQPKIETIVGKRIDQPTVAILGLEKGELDVIAVTAPDDIERVKGNSSVDAWSSPLVIINSLFFNVSKPYFSDKRVRAAFLYALDRPTIVQKLWKGAAQIINSPITTSWVDQSDLNQYPYDVAKAKQLLKDANWDPNQKVELMVYYTDEFNRKLVTAFQQYWQDAGINVTIRQADSAQLQPDIDSLKFDVEYLGGPGGTDPSDVAAYFWSKTPLSPYNKIIKDPDYDKLYEASLLAVDQSKRAAVYHDIAKTLNDRNWWATVWAPLRYWAASKRVQNIHGMLGTPIYWPSFYQAEETWTLAT